MCNKACCFRQINHKLLKRAVNVMKFKNICSVFLLILIRNRVRYNKSKLLHFLLFIRNGVHFECNCMLDCFIVPKPNTFLTSLFQTSKFAHKNGYMI